MTDLLEQGYLYVATGGQYVDEALTSVRSLRKFDSEIHATLVTDQAMDLPEFDLVRVLAPDETQAGRWKEGILYKVAGLRASPYKKTFFIDSDTYFCDDCDELFPLLDYFDLLICHSPGDVSETITENGPLEGYYPYNTGVLVYNNTAAMQRFFAEWQTRYLERFDRYHHDQPALMEALLHSDIKTYVLQSIYNFRYPDYFVAFAPKQVKIIHGRATDYERIARILNEQVPHRVWISHKERVVLEQYSLRYRIKHGLYRLTPEFMRRAYRTMKRAARSGS